MKHQVERLHLGGFQSGVRLGGCAPGRVARALGLVAVKTRLARASFEHTASVCGGHTDGTLARSVRKSTTVNAYQFYPLSV